jgi:peptidoglycan-associated lipoprotein
MQSLKTGAAMTMRTGVVLALVALTGCGYAKRKDVDAQLTQMRTDMETGDQGVENRLNTKIDETNTRVASLEQKAQALEGELQSMRSEFNTQIDQMKGMLSFNVPVHFEFASSDLRGEDQTVLNRFAGVVKEYYPNAVVTVEGFTDPAGSASYNMRLGQSRAESVKAYLEQQGLTTDAIKVVSYGESRDRQVLPGAQGPGEDGMQNRRVSLVIDYSGDPLAVRPITN